LAGHTILDFAGSRAKRSRTRALATLCAVSRAIGRLASFAYRVAAGRHCETATAQSRLGTCSGKGNHCQRGGKLHQWRQPELCQIFLQLFHANTFLL
jgi:hypothetical protein